MKWLCILLNIHGWERKTDWLDPEGCSIHYWKCRHCDKTKPRRWNE